MRADIADAIALHRAVDGYTDRHPIVAEAKARFEPPLRRYAGVALDLYFDHCLTRAWSDYAAFEFDAFIDDTYEHLQSGLDSLDLPEETHRFVDAMISNDWLRAFVDFEGVENALARLNHAIRRRFAREVDLRPLGLELSRLAPDLDRAFVVLFPDLVGFVETRRVGS